jgi:hypothetical protein
MKLFSKKFSYNLKPLLYNQLLLYFFTLAALFDLVYFLNTKDFMSFFIFIIIGFLTTFFSKNMIVILVIALCVTHIIKYGTSAYVSEGFDSSSSSDATSSDDSSTSEDTKKATKDDKSKTSDTKKSDTKSSGSKKIELSEIQEDYKKLDGIQDKIINNLKEINPLLEKAEAFITKYEAYKSQGK